MRTCWVASRVVQSQRARRAGSALGLAAGLLIALVGLLASARPAAAQSFGESIRSFRSDVAVQQDGSVVITETIDYDFGGASHHGIDRFVPTRVPYDEAKKGYDRLFPMDVLSVSSDAPHQYETSTDKGYTRIRIGDPASFVTGTHTYVIKYRIRGGLNHFKDH